MTGVQTCALPISAGAILAGINAAVVGLLAAAFYKPVWTSAVQTIADMLFILVAFVLLQRYKTPPILIAALCVGASLVSTLMT